jgi:hypothetical protein
VETDNGKKQTYTFLAEKHLPSDIFVQRWTDVLAVNNNVATNGGYIFSAYEWYKNDDKLPSTKGYIHEPDGFDPSAIYWARLTSQYGTIDTCPAEITDETSTTWAIYPNPVHRGQTVRVDGRDAINRVSTTTTSMATMKMQLFSATGNIISTQNVNVPVSEIAMPDTPGAYILQVTVNGRVETFKIVVE